MEFNKRGIVLVLILIIVILFTIFVYSNPGAPSITDLILNSSENLNTSQENLTISFAAADIDGDNVKNITVWYLNNQSLPVLYLPFENNSNSSFTEDYSSYHNDGNVTDAQYLPTGGYDGFGAYEFDGSGDCITIPRTNFNITQNLTVTFWFKSYMNSTQYQHIVSRDDLEVLKSHFYFRYSSTGIQFFVSNVTVFYSATHRITSGMTTDIWHFVAGTFSESGNSTNNAIKLYVDGVLRATTYVNGNIGIKSMIDLHIGCHNPTAYFFNGTIDEVMIFNRSLSAEEIAFLWENKTNILSSNEIKMGNIWQANITPVDINQERGTSVNSSYIKILNGKPVVSSSFSPSDASDLEDINISIQYFDKEADLGNMTFLLYKNDILINQTNFTNLAGNVLVSQYINSSEYIGGDNIIVSAYAFDGEFNSSIMNSSIIPTYPIVKGAVYKPTYGNEEVELVVLTMGKGNSIENNRRQIGSRLFNVSYRVRDPNNIVYQDWKNITMYNNSFGNTTFNLSSGISGTYFIDLKPDYATIPTEIINFTFSDYVALPFYRENIIKAADFVISNQNAVNGNISEEYTQGIGVRVLAEAYRITGNYTYYNGSVNYLKKGNLKNDANMCMYGTCTYSEFQLYSNDTRFQSNISKCANAAGTSPLINGSAGVFGIGELMYCLDKAYEATNNITIKLYSNNGLINLLNPNNNFWNFSKNTWNAEQGIYIYLDMIYTGSLPAFGLYGNNSNSTYIDLAKRAQDYFTPNFYQNTSYGRNLSTLYSQEIYGEKDSGTYDHFTAEPVIAMVGLYNATNDREWLLKASIGARYLSYSQQEDGRYCDEGLSGGETYNVWITMWVVWALEKFPPEVSVDIVDYRYNLTINDARWYESKDKLWANVSIPSGELSYIKFTVQNSSNKFAYIDSVQTSNYAIDGNTIYVWLTGSNHIIEVGPPTYPFFYNITFWDNVTSTYDESGNTFNGSFTMGDLDANDNFNISTFWYEGDTIIISNNTDGSNMSNYTSAQVNGSMKYISQNLTSDNYRFGYNYSLGIYACDSNGNCNESNSTILFISTAPPGPPSGCSNCGRDEPEPPPEEPEDEDDEDIIVIPEDDIITIEMPDATLKLILDDVGLLKKKPRISIEFKIPEVLGMPRLFKLFCWRCWILFLIILSIITFSYSNYQYIRSGEIR